MKNNKEQHKTHTPRKDKIKKHKEQSGTIKNKHETPRQIIMHNHYT